MYKHGSKFSREYGAATLLVTVVLLALITVVSISITKVGLLEVKTTANTNRAKEALHNAQAGIDYGALRALAGGESWAVGSFEAVPVLNGASVAVRGIVSGSILSVEAVGESLDGTGIAEVSEDYGRFPLLAFGELPPLMSNGNFPPSGTFSIVGNPNGGGDGVPVSAWVDQSTTTGGASWQTCQYDEWLYEGNNASATKIEHDEDGDGVPEFIQCDNCDCKDATNYLCAAGDVSNPSECEDVVEDTGIPEVFENTFGKPVAQWEEFMSMFAKKMTCNELNAFGTAVGDEFTANELPLIWVEGDCSLDSIGSYSKPVIIFVHGDVTLNGGDIVFGIVFAFSDPDASETNNLQLNGTPIVYGVILVNADVNLPSGNFSLVYSQKLLEKLSEPGGETLYGIGRRAGSWTDFN